MKILVITQKVDVEDPVLGFFHGWLSEFSKHFKFVTVIALGVGQYNLPTNVKVLSLGKESGASKIKYLVNFFRYIWRERKNYDAVFVHMNQEYVLLAGLWWRLIGKKVVMWRNHHSGNFLTDLAARLCNKVFCTSKFSYTAKYKKTVLMPVGVDTDVFMPTASADRKPRSILFLARMSPVKKPHLLIEALAILRDRGIGFSASFYGDPVPADATYYQGLKDQVDALDLKGQMRFFPGLPNTKTPPIYASHDIFVNLSSDGMYDKTIFEAMSCETNIVASNKNLLGLIDGRHVIEDLNVNVLVDKISYLIGLSDQDKKNSGHNLRQTAIDHHSLDKLTTCLTREIL